MFYMRIIPKQACRVWISFSIVDEATKWWHLHNRSQHKIDPATAEHNHKHSTHTSPQTRNTPNAKMPFQKLQTHSKGFLMEYSMSDCRMCK